MKVTTEHIYLGGYAIVILVSSLTIYIARKAARINDLEEAKKKLDSNTPTESKSTGTNGNSQKPLEGTKEDE
ncbi:MAG: hypothetical protein HQ513_13850 [Rhodospirillales bacterium]|nr:hypothetical protein [Rhodospirillales bacterium]